MSAPDPVRASFLAWRREHYGNDPHGTLPTWSDAEAAYRAAYKVDELEREYLEACYSYFVDWMGTSPPPDDDKSKMSRAKRAYIALRAHRTRLQSEKAAAVEVLDWQAQVRAFHERHGQPVGTTAITDKERLLSRDKWLNEEVLETYEASLNGDIEGVADGLADIIYIALGTAVELGIPMDRVFAEVHAANMRKLVDPSNPGKIRKGPDWVGPNIAAALSGGAA